MSPRPPPKSSLRHEWTKELGSKVVQQPEGETVRQPEEEVVRQTKFFQSTQPTPNRPGKLRAPSQQGSNLIVSARTLVVGGSNQNDAASSSQVWQRDAKTNDSARKLAAETRF